MSADPLLFSVGAVHLSVALPCVDPEPPLPDPELPLPDPELPLPDPELPLPDPEPPLLGGGVDPEPLLGGDVDPEPLLDGGVDPEELDGGVAVELEGLLAVLAEGEVEPEPPPQPERMSTATPRPQSVFSGPMDTSSPGWTSGTFDRSLRREATVRQRQPVLGSKRRARESPPV